MKRILAAILFLTMLLAVPAVAAEPQNEPWCRTEGDGSYVTLYLDTPDLEQMSWSESRYITARYADTGEPIPLTSNAYHGNYLFVTVPAKDADRPVEVFVAEYNPYADCVNIWDGHEYDQSPVGTLELSIRGIFKGDEKGHLNPEQAITRAEAFTIICRLLSLTPSGDPGFVDVSTEDWFYETASAAKATGITNEPEYFRPQSQVTRSEFTVMLYRAMKTLGWATVKDTREDLLASNIVDVVDIPDWALDAYLAFLDRGVNIFDSGGDMDTVEFTAAPAHPATRGEVVEMVKNALRSLPVYPTKLAMEWGFDEKMPVIDGSTSTKPYTDAVYGMLFTNYSGHPQYPEKHSKSYYSYERLISGEADILFASTKPTQATLDMAKAAGVELELIPIAHDSMVFFTNRENSIENLTMEQIRAIYVDNAYDNWKVLGGPDAGLIPYCRNADSGSQAQMEEFFLKGEEIHPAIRQETISTSMASVLTDVQNAMTTDPLAYALGYSIYYYYQQVSMILLYPSDSLKLLSVEGIYPNDETIADKSYPLAGYNYAVIRADAKEGSPASRMVEFMLSPEGQGCVMNAGFGPLMKEG